METNWGIMFVSFCNSKISILEINSELKHQVSHGISLPEIINVDDPSQMSG